MYYVHLYVSASIVGGGVPMSTPLTFLEDSKSYLLLFTGDTGRQVYSIAYDGCESRFHLKCICILKALCAYRAKLVVRIPQ